jgi:plastocyanin
MPRSLGIALVVGALAGIAAGCGGGGGTTNPPPPPPPPPSVTIAMASPSGDAQTGLVGSALPNPLRVLVTQSGSPKSGSAVTWAISQASGSVNPASSSTDANGIAQTTVTLPTVAATSTVTATLAGAIGSPVSFSAISTGASQQVTVSVVNFAFQPATSTIGRGGTVSFVWASGAGPHTVTPVAPNTIPVVPGDPTAVSAPFNFDVIFPATGTFDFYCRVHGAPGFGMSGTITVVP